MLACTSSDKLVGVGAGLGYEFNIRLVHGETGGKKSTEIAHVEIFTRPATRGALAVRLRRQGRR